ncbi:hypothetical protein [Actinokineospora cianjurensis]|uniref:Uncharacterized protein n=1 Tax=Actinokineospora cianjurensis TaxID=585224 RepID=A0A421AY17_9PSEU|nr:hypothetical protein [Actinokineospora cianjurensis]RLK54726.1 hypothetical protein CLV68_5760 [Actinokineospora cianjurensis]
MDNPWWTVDPTTAPPHTLDRLLLAVEHHITLRTSPNDLARRRAHHWLHANDLSTLADPPH